MRGSRWVAGLVLVLVGAAGLTAAPVAKDSDAEGYDLRGPAPKKGQVTVAKSTFKLKDASLALKIADMNIKGKQTLTATDEEEVTVLAVEGRQVTKALTKVRKQQVETVTSILDQEMSDKKAGDLEGEVLISTRTGPGKWKHVLEDARPTEKQKKELENRVGPENQDHLVPEGKVKVGQTWTVEASALQRVFGAEFTDLKGKLTMKLARAEPVDGQSCAVLESAGTTTGVARTDEGPLQVELTLKGTTWQSLKTGLDVKDRAEGKIKLSGTVEKDEQKVEILLEGPFTLEASKRRK